MSTDLPLESERIEVIEQFLNQWLIDEGLPGASVVITRTDGRTWAAGTGSRNLEENLPATGETLYAVGSVTKSFTALAVLQLVDRGAIDINEPITAHISAAIPGSDDRTIHDILTHHSGISSLATSEVLIARHTGIGEAGIPLGNRADLMRHLENAGEAVGPPQQRFQYSNCGYILLADLVAAVDGRALPTYLREELFEPLGMDRSTFSGTEYTSMEDHTTPYWMEDGSPRETSLPVRELSWGAGGLLTSVKELAPYLRLHLGSGCFDGERILAEDLIQRAHDGHVDTPVGPYGYGWRTRQVADRAMVGHGGSVAVSTAYAGFIPDEDIGIAVAVNAAPAYSLAHLGEAIAAAAVGADPRSVPYFTRQRRLERITGRYESYRGIRSATVEEADGMIVITYSDPFGDDRHLLTPTDPMLESYRFYRIGDRGERRGVEFVVDGDAVDLYIDRWRFTRC